MCVLFCCCWCTQASNLYIYICAFVHAFSGLYDIVLGGLFAENKVFSCSPKDWKVLVLCACMLHACLLWFSVFSCSPPLLRSVTDNKIGVNVCMCKHTYTYTCLFTHTHFWTEEVDNTHTHTHFWTQEVDCFVFLIYFQF